MRLTTVLLAFAGLSALIYLGLAGSARAQAGVASGGAAPGLPTSTNAPRPNAGACPVSADSLVLAGEGLVRSRAAVAAGRLTILAVGSSSIEGIGASRVELGFVPLLQSGLRDRLPNVAVNVWNRGVGGETARQTVDRLQGEIERYQPDLVIWQLGTNDVLQARPWNDIMADIHRGEAILSRHDVDVLLIDPQRLPDNAVNFPGRNPSLDEAARLIATEGNRVGYAVQRRFEAMKDWGRLNRGGIGPDDLHMNDDGYACWAAITAEGLAQALKGAAMERSAR